MKSNERVWESLLEIKRLLSHPQPDVKWITLNFTSNSIELQLNDTGSESSILIELKEYRSDIHADVHIRCTKPFSFELIKNELLNDDQLQLILLYLPYALLPSFVDTRTRPFTITHFAQTLDGRIALESNKSKWIGNEDNLVHAHRMRALCDAVLIGSKTLVADNPRLTVRHVQGQDPVKVIVGGDHLELENYTAVHNNSIMFSQNHIDKKFDVKTHHLNKENDQYKSAEILEKLFQSGIRAVYIEGGAYTSSHFLCDGCVDQIQIHISPMIIGSGINGFNFEGVNHMHEAMTFSTYRYYSIGDAVMFIGEM